MRGLLTPFLAILVLSSVPARAEPPATAGRGQIGGVLAGGVGLNDGGDPTGTLGRTNLYGFGLGPRGGYTFPKVPVYLGGVFLFFLGERESVSVLGFDVKARAGYMLLGIEGGYDFGVGPVIIRPSLWLGPAILRAKVCNNGDCNGDSDTSVVIGPGASVIYAFDKIPLWLGGELRFAIVPGELQNSTQNHQTALLFGAQIGMLLGD